MVDQAPVGLVVGDAAPFQGAGQLGEEAALRPHQDRHAAIGDAFP
jgi:hypothetical protein